MDFVELKKVVHAVLDRMDHQWLNDLPPFDQLNPSAENMAKYIYDEVTRGSNDRRRRAGGVDAPLGNRHRQRDLPAVGRRCRRSVPKSYGRNRPRSWREFAHFSGRSSSAKIADTGQTGTHAPQSMHSTGSM